MQNNVAISLCNKMFTILTIRQFLQIDDKWEILQAIISFSLFIKNFYWKIIDYVCQLELYNIYLVKYGMKKRTNVTSP